jgi:CheY-like chemotaxis protein
MPKRKILIIDDEQDFTKIVKINLEQTGKYDVYIENNPLSALSSVKNCKPDLILLDIIMPGTDGFKVLQMLKKDTVTISTPVIMLTAVMTDDAKEKASSLYDEGYLEKPITSALLEKTIDKVLKRRENI